MPPVNNEIDARALILDMASLGSRVSTAIVEATDKTGMETNFPIVVLINLEMSGKLRPSDVAALTGLTSGGATKLVARMEAAGVVVRVAEENPDDLRTVAISLTEEGHRYLRTVYEVIKDSADDIRAYVHSLQVLVGDQPSRA